ncbi:MAG: dienelactone hydrolase family protein, partial [Phycisphaerae bacterium]|nr:dienelactone hydrolase family protein [Gemmatimonadaceae bacterium]
VAIGFSNGANIAASLLLTHPWMLRAAVLFSPMIPFRPETDVDLSQMSVFIGAGRTDHIVSPEQTQAFASLLRDHGAKVVIHWGPGGHAITPHHVAAAREWILRQTSPSEAPVR